jgi:putative transposase
MKKRFTEAQIVGFLREADAGIPIKDLCRKHGFSDASYYLWRSKFGGMSVSDAKRLKELETENGRLKKLLADSLLENEVTREVLRKNGDCTSPARGGAGDDHARVDRAPRAGDRAHERVVAAVPARAGSERVPPRPHCRAGPSPSSVGRRHDLSETATGRRHGESQARRSALRGSSTPSETSAQSERAYRIIQNTGA